LNTTRNHCLLLEDIILQSLRLRPQAPAMNAGPGPNLAAFTTSLRQFCGQCGWEAGTSALASIPVEGRRAASCLADRQRPFLAAVAVVTTNTPNHVSATSRMSASLTGMPARQCKGRNSNLDLLYVALDQLALFGSSADLGLAIGHRQSHEIREGKRALALDSRALFPILWVQALEDAQSCGRIRRNMLDRLGTDNFALELKDLFTFE